MFRPRQERRQSGPETSVDLDDLRRAFHLPPAPRAVVLLDDEEPVPRPLLDDDYTLPPPTSQELIRDALRDLPPSGATGDLTMPRMLAGVSDDAPDPDIAEERPASASPSPDVISEVRSIQFLPQDGDDLDLFGEFGPDVLTSNFFGPSQSQSQSRPPLPPMTPPGSQEIADRPRRAARPAGKSFPPAGKSFPPAVPETGAGDSMEIDASNLVVQPAAEELDPVFFDPLPPAQPPDVDELDYRVEPDVEEAKQRELAEAAKKLRVAEAVERKRRAATERNQRAVLEAEEEAEAEARRARDERARYMADTDEQMMAEEEADWVLRARMDVVQAAPTPTPVPPPAPRTPAQPPVPLPSDDEAWRLPYVLDAFVRTLRSHAEDLRQRWPDGPPALDAMVAALAPVGAQSPFDAIAFLGGARRPLADDDAAFSAAFLAAFPPLPAYIRPTSGPRRDIGAVSDALHHLERAAKVNYRTWRDAAQLATAWMDRPDAVPNAREMRLLVLVLAMVHVPLCYAKLLALRRAIVPAVLADSIETADIVRALASLQQQTHAELSRVWASSEANDLAALATPRAQRYLSDATLAAITADIDSVPSL